MLAVCAPAPVHAHPALRPARALLIRIPLGPRPSLHRLRGGLLRFVRRLPSYYGEVRLLGSVHHRLRLLTFPMRAGNGGAVPVRPDPAIPPAVMTPLQRAGSHLSSQLGGRLSRNAEMPSSASRASRFSTMTSAV